MDDWVLWMIAAGVLAVGEIVTLGFFLGPIAVAALVTAIVALAGGGVALQLVVFTLVAASSVAVLRPIARGTCTPRRSCAPAWRPWWARARSCSSGWTRTAAA